MLAGPPKVASHPSCGHRGEMRKFFEEGPNSYVLRGAIVGGPDRSDFFLDKRKNYTFTEVALDYNTLYTSALAALSAAPVDFWDVDCALHVPKYPWPKAMAAAAAFPRGTAPAVVDGGAIEPPTIYDTAAASPASTVPDPVAADDVPTVAVPADTVPADEVPADAVPVPEDEVPADAVPVPEDEVPADAVPVPEDEVPADAVPADAVTAPAVPADAVTAPAAPADAVTAPAAPADAVTAPAAPADAVTAPAVPVDAAATPPAELTPEQARAKREAAAAARAATGR
jgi:hypothetical protein